MDYKVTGSRLELLRELNRIAFQAKQHLKKSTYIVEYDKTSIELSNAISDSICKGFLDPEGTENSILDLSYSFIEDYRKEALANKRRPLIVFGNMSMRALDYIAPVMVRARSRVENIGDVEAAIFNISIECIKHLRPELLVR